jgi:hypothetical protein
VVKVKRLYYEDLYRGIDSMITYVVYSHSEYSDILSAQTHYLSSYENKVLLIDKSGAELTDLCSSYKRVLFYDDTLPYASRLLKLAELDLDYILFIHDIDIVVKKDDTIIEYLLELMRARDIDRIDLRYKNNPNSKEMLLLDKNNLKFYLNRQDEHSEPLDNNSLYAYNVNPSIWKISTLLEIMTKFKDENYRTIELAPTQNFCQQEGYKIYKFYWESYINCGWCACMPFFQYIHLTHNGKLLPINGGNLNKSLMGSYLNILQQFSLIETRDFATHFDKKHNRAPEYYHGPSVKKEWS